MFIWYMETDSYPLSSRGLGSSWCLRPDKGDFQSCQRQFSRLGCPREITPKIAFKHNILSILYLLIIFFFLLHFCFFLFMFFSFSCFILFMFYFFSCFSFLFMFFSFYVFFHFLFLYFNCYFLNFMWVLGRKEDVFSFQSQPRTDDSLPNTTSGKHQLMKASAIEHNVQFKSQSIPALRTNKQILHVCYWLCQLLSVDQRIRTCL